MVDVDGWRTVDEKDELNTESLPPTYFLHFSLRSFKKSLTSSIQTSRSSFPAKLGISILHSSSHQA